MAGNYHLYAYEDYKVALKDRVKYLKSTNPSVTLRKLADQIPIQYTFLSKVLNQPGHHLSEDHLFRACRFLDFLDEEIEFIGWMRSHAVSQEPDRKQYIFEKLESTRKTKILNANHEQGSVESAKLFNEMKFFFEPMAMIVNLSLRIKEYRENPRRLCSILGISNEKLKEILENLNQFGLIELGSSPFEIKDVFPRKHHYGREHPFMRVYQSRAKSLLNSRMQQSSEEDKESFLVSFSADKEALPQIKELFSKFIREVQGVCEKSPSRSLYQLNFDLLRWL